MNAIFKVTVIAAVLLISEVAFAKMYGARLCDSSPYYYCHNVQKGETWQSLFGSEADLVMSVNRSNNRLRPGMKIAVPNDLGSASKLSVSPLPQTIPAPGTKTIIVSLSRLAWGAYYSDGTLADWGPVSGGQGYCPDTGRGCHTPRGTFYIYEKRGADCFSTKFPLHTNGGAPMPYCMFFKGGFALHGSYDVPGFNASHGCVRLFINHARWLNEEFTAGSRVKVEIQ